MTLADWLISPPFSPVIFHDFTFFATPCTSDAPRKYYAYGGLQWSAQWHI